jgi:hypothetical protein
VFDRFGSSQRAARDLVADQLLGADSSVRDLDIESTATAVLLVCQSFVFASRFIGQDELKQLRQVLEGYLR